jgi:AP-3 complex subunit mu
MSQFPNLFILSSAGEILIDKQWLGREKRSVVEIYIELVSKIVDKNDVPPILQSNKHYFFSSQRWNLTFLVIANKETQALYIIELLHEIQNVLYNYLNEMSESIIRENFSLIYQLLDEIIDGGFASTIELNQLKDMIIPPSLARKLINTVTGKANK